jgi:hypothetical protein
MVGIFSRLIDYMEEEQWKYEILEDETAIRFNSKGRNGRVLCFCEVDESKYWLTIYSFLPVNVPQHKIVAAAEYVSRANRGIRIGNFEFDYDDGEIRYKTSIDVEGGELTSKMIDNLLKANLTAVDRYYGGAMELIYGDKSAEQIIRSIEGNFGRLDTLGVDPDLDDLEDETPFTSDDDEIDNDNRIF